MSPTARLTSRPCSRSARCTAASWDGTSPRWRSWKYGGSWTRTPSWKSQRPPCSPDDIRRSSHAARASVLPLPARPPHGRRHDHPHPPGPSECADIRRVPRAALHVPRARRRARRAGGHHHGSRPGVLLGRRRRGHHRSAVRARRGGAARIHPPHVRSHPRAAAMPAPGRRCLERNRGGRGSRHRGSVRRARRRRVGQDRVPVHEGRTVGRRHGCRLAPAPHRRARPRGRAAHDRRFHRRPDGTPHRPVQPGRGGRRGDGGGARARRAAGPGTVGRTGDHEGRAQPRSAHGPRDGARGRGARPGRVHAESQLPRSLRGFQGKARAQVRLTVPDSTVITAFLTESHVALAGRITAYAAREIAALPEPADAMFALQALGTVPILLAGDAPLKERWLPAVLAGRAIASFAMTEPEAGSDAAAIATTARRDGTGYVLRGTKTFISNAGIADFYTVFASTDQGKGQKGISAFVVAADTPGLKFVRPLVLSAPHPLGEIAFEDCRVPASDRLGAEGEGFKLGLATLDRLRATVAAAACGMGARALQEALEHATRRRQFGRALAEFQLVQEKLARMATELTAARLLTYRAAWEKDRGAERVTLEAAMAKAFATEAAQRIVDDAVQILGGRGVLASHPVDRLYRAVRALRIYEGTTEIQHLIVAEQLLKRAVGAV